MATFNYKAKDKGGERVQASTDAPSRLEALAQLRAAGLTVLNVWQDNPTASGIATLAVRTAGTRARPARRHLRACGNGEKALLMRQISISVGAGMGIRDALQAIAEDMDHPALRSSLLAIGDKLREGQMFSEATTEHPAIFSRLTVALLRVAEEAGSMPQTLDYLANALERSDRLERKIRSILAYPLFVAGFFVLICSIMTIFVLPKFQANFGAEQTLPLLSRVVFGTNRFLLEHIVLIGGALAGLLVLGAQYVRTATGRLQADTLVLRLPLVGPCVQKFTVARFCRNLAIMLRGGVPVATAMEIASSVCNNRAMEVALGRIRTRVISGATIAASLEQEPVFPRLIVRMTNVGEASGKLPQILDKVSDTYEDQVEGAITIAIALLEPILICCFGFFVLLLVLAIYLPVFLAARGLQ
jgi:type II secretory pathway component PulF